MKKTIYIFISILLFSCDPSESLEANIINNSSINFEIIFSSSELPDFNQTLKIESQKKSLYTEINPGLGRVGLDFIDFDSIYIKDNSDNVLKVYKQNTTGKNIYNVDEFWIVKESPKNHFIYSFEITDEDLN